jgi:maleate isomerase
MTYEAIIPRARIGFIIPTSNRLVEPQMQQYMPPGVVPHFTRIGMTNTHKAPLDQLLPRILHAASMLAESDCAVTVLQCTGTSMSGGVDAEKHVIAEIERTTGRPAISAASAVTAALGALNARRLVFLSETKQDGHDEKLKFLRAMGYNVLADKAAGLSGSAEYSTMPPQFWFDQAVALRRNDADAYFISCANIHSIPVIRQLEQELGRPVVTSNQASLWLSLRKAKIYDVVPALGQLLQHDSAVAQA